MLPLGASIKANECLGYSIMASFLMLFSAHHSLEKCKHFFGGAVAPELVPRLVLLDVDEEQIVDAVVAVATAWGEVMPIASGIPTG